MDNKYLELVPKPLLNDFVNNRVVPFVGAGFSKNADIPDGLSMPDWNELGKLAAAEIKDYEYDNNAIDTLSYYESLYTRTKLIEFLMSVLHAGAIHPGETYKAFCDLFTGTICTTNYDFLLEEMMSTLHRPISTIVTEDRLTVNTPNENRILKLHGDFNHPEKMVITEHDYDMYLEKNPVFATYVSNLFITNTMLLIGYSLDDDDFRGIWHILNDRLGGMTQPAYCITVGASQAQLARYSRRNIHAINLPGKKKDYKTILRDFFIEIKNYVSEEKDKTVKSKDDRINEQLIIPSDDNKLCFISCSMPRVAQLSSLLYPILHNHGVTPVRVDDMIMPGDNWIDVSRAIIRKTRLAIVDVSDGSPYVLTELSMLKSEKKNVMIICEDGLDIPSSLSDLQIQRYTFGFNVQKIKSFVHKVTEWIDNSIEIASNQEEEQSLFENAKRLLQKKEYSACIVSAFSDFEFYIRKNHPELRTNNSWPLLIKDTNNTDRLKEIRMLRNKIVHGRYDATHDEAEHVIEVLSSINID